MSRWNWHIPPARSRAGRWGRRLLISAAAAMLLFALLDVCFPLRVQVAYAPLVRARDSSVLYAWMARDEQWRLKASLSEISPELRKAIVYKEDRHFYRHFGINPLAAGRALFHNIWYRRRTSGASTISMQVARMLQPRARTYWHKCVEMFRALQLEMAYDKEEILQLYLNLVPYGSNIQGVKAASLLYFRKTPDQLSLAELTALSIIPNRPNALLMGRDNARITAARNRWLRRFGQAGLFEPALIRDALQEPLHARRHNAPRQAPQLAWRMRWLQPGADELLTTIDPAMQQQLSDIVAAYTAGLKLQHIHNAAVLVVDNRSMEVLAYIGSPDFEDYAHQGQVDGVMAVRSPGSALKPLLYGLAFDRGLATPAAVVADVPVNYQGYTPENYDLGFRGQVTVAEALRQSLNIPAVSMLQQLGVQQMAASLVAAGFRSVWKDRRRLGLSLALGGCGVRLDEMTGLYAAFARGGVYRPLRFLKSQAPADSGQRILSGPASYMVSHIMTELARPDLPNHYEHARDLPRIAWKTGTSYGRRDGWSIGYNERYTIGVWTGNFNGKGVSGLSGAQTATPLLFRLFQAIDRQAGQEWLRAPRELGMRLVCASSGLPPSELCTEQVMDGFIPGISANGACSHMREVWVSADEQVSYCTSCLPEAGYRIRTFANLPPEVLAWQERQAQGMQRVPPHNPACGRLFEGQAPEIISLQNGLTYIIADKGRQKLQLNCRASRDVSRVFWYVNDRYIGAGPAGQPLMIDATEPVLRIACSDDRGRVSHIQVQLRFL